MSAIPRLVAANIDVLEQGARLVARLDDQVYATQHAVVFESAIGAHVRHVVDTVESCTVGLPVGRLDYEVRRRDPEVERSRAAGLRALVAAAGRLTSLRTSDISVWLRARAGDPAGAWVLTSAERELEFLYSHTVHHFALIAVLCRLAGLEPEPTFGIAPSTLRHRGILPKAPP